MSIISEQINQIEKNRSRLSDPEKTIDQIVVHKMPGSSKINNREFVTGSINEVENKRVRGVHKKSKLLGWFIIAAGILVVAALVYFGYNYLKKPVALNNINETPVVTEDKTNNEVSEVPIDNNLIASSSDVVTEEQASSTPETPAVVEEPISRPIIKDSDADGLFDVEEFLLGSDIVNTDSDSDSYSDYIEALGLYNPAGNGKLENSQMISKYRSPSYSFSILYPTSWSVGSTSDNSSVVFKINNSSFIQIIIEPNTEKEEIAAWYQRQFPSDLISGERLAKIGTLDAVSSADGLIIYATDLNKENLYIISYVPEDENRLEYSNIFSIILKSFNLF